MLFDCKKAPPKLFEEANNLGTALAEEAHQIQPQCIRHVQAVSGDSRDRVESPQIF